MNQELSNTESRGWSAFISDHLTTFASIVVGLVVVVLYFGRDIWIEALAELLAQRLGWRVWICECLIWIGVFFLLGLIGLICYTLGFVKDEPPQKSAPNPHDKCPKCGFEYRWDGKLCGHCGHMR